MSFADDCERNEVSNVEKNFDPTEIEDGHNLDRLKRAAITALSAAAVKAKLLAKLEEDEVRRLVSLIIDKQVLKEICILSESLMLICGSTCPKYVYHLKINNIPFANLKLYITVSYHGFLLCSCTSWKQNCHFSLTLKVWCCG